LLVRLTGQVVLDPIIALIGWIRSESGFQAIKGAFELIDTTTSEEQDIITGASRITAYNW
jgi:hypothetical protein